MRDVCQYSTRVERAKTEKRSRLEKMAELDEFMPALKGACPYHFVLEGTIVPDHFPRCPLMPSADVQAAFQKFRRAFSFEKFAYCFSCGMPQDRKNNGEGPRCHGDHAYAKDSRCAFAQFIFRVSFCIWEMRALRERMRAGLLIRESLSTAEEFTQWAKREEVGGYHNCLESLLWFCRLKKQESPRFFM